MHQLWPQSWVQILTPPVLCHLDQVTSPLGYHFLAYRMGVAMAPVWWSQGDEGQSYTQST